MKFDFLVPYIKERLTDHHKLYRCQCKAELWEEILFWVLMKSGIGSDWEPDFNHKPGVDQTTDCGIRISNKSGKLYPKHISISGSRLTKYNSLTEKLNFLSVKKEDYIFCLAAKKEEWLRGIKKYYFIVIDSNILNYSEQEWKETYGKTQKLTGWNCISESFSAKISKSMSDQLWTDIKLNYCQEIYDITIDSK